MYIYNQDWGQLSSQRVYQYLCKFKVEMQEKSSGNIFTDLWKQVYKPMIQILR